MTQGVTGDVLRSTVEQQRRGSVSAPAARCGDVLPAGTAASEGSRLLRQFASWAWVVLELPFALPAAPAFALAAIRLRSRAVGYEAAGYLAATVTWVALAAQHGAANSAGVILALITTVVAVARAAMLRNRLFFPSPTQRAPLPPPLRPAAEPAPWTPTFPAQELPPRDPNDPSTWVTPVACTGSDRHALSLTPRHAALMGVAGVVLIALDVHLHVYGRGLGAGIGLALAPALAALFARWVDGPVLYYRSWGRLHELRLDTVTAVTTGKRAAGAVSVLLAAHGLAKPLRVSLRNRGYVMPPAARDHLRGWMSAPQVQWAPAAVALFDAHTTTSTGRARRRLRVLRLAFGVVLPIVAIGGRVAIAYETNVHRAIPGAAGYYRFAGPHAKLLAVGRPWGTACQPLRFELDTQAPDWVYTQAATVFDEARRDGLNVTLATRTLQWLPQSLYYPPGQSPLTARPVWIAWRTGTPPPRGDGAPQHISLDWNAAVDADGQHEDLTSAGGELWMLTLEQPQAVRRSIRQLIAMTQGILRTTHQDSGIALDTHNDRFSAADIKAMKLMSGCGDSVPPAAP